MKIIYTLFTHYDFEVSPPWEGIFPGLFQSAPLPPSQEVVLAEY